MKYCRFRILLSMYYSSDFEYSVRQTFVAIEAKEWSYSHTYPMPFKIYAILWKSARRLDLSLYMKACLLLLLAYYLSYFYARFTSKVNMESRLAPGASKEEKVVHE